MYIHKQKRHVHAYAHIYILKKKTICLQIYKNTCTYENTCKQTHAHTYITYLTNHIMTCHSIPHHAVSYCSMPFHTVPYRPIPFHTTTFQYIQLHRYVPIQAITYHRTLHTIACRCLPLPYAALQCSALHYAVTLHVWHYIALRYITLQYHYITLHYITLRCVTLHCITLLCINYITLNYNTIHCIMTLQYAKLHYICACTKPPRIKLPSHSRCLSTHFGIWQKSAGILSTCLLPRSNTYAKLPTVIQIQDLHACIQT